MARYYYPGARDTVEGAKTIDMKWLNSQGYLSGYNSINLSWSSKGESRGDINVKINTDIDGGEKAYIQFDYKSRNRGEEEWKSMNYKFDLIAVRCHFGGNRWYFRCGLSKNGIFCGRCVRILYGIGSWFGCRHCADLSYESCNESKKFRVGVFRMFTDEDKAREYYEKYVKRIFYKGNLTRKYKRYLVLDAKTSGIDNVGWEELLLKKTL